MWVRHLEEMEAARMRAGTGDEWLRVLGVKMYGDGSIGSRTAALYRPYRDDPANRGQLNMTRAQMSAVITRARRLGLQACIHAIGDRGVDEVIAAYEAAARRTTLPKFRGERHRIEHCELVSAKGLRRMRRLGLVASVQPNFVGQWSRKGQMYDQRIGARWHGRDNPMRRILEAGVPLAFGSDNMPFGPLYGIASAVRAPAPAQRLTPRQALAAYTRDAAWALREETSRGTLEVGKLADVVVLDGNPLRRSGRLDRLRPWATVVGGRMRFKQPG
jgi:predicted amidohydrolase YtcJ